MDGGGELLVPIGLRRVGIISRAVVVADAAGVGWVEAIVGRLRLLIRACNLGEHADLSGLVAPNSVIDRGAGRFSEGAQLFTFPKDLFARHDVKGKGDKNADPITTVSTTQGYGTDGRVVPCWCIEECNP